MEHEKPDQVKIKRCKHISFMMKSYNTSSSRGKKLGNMNSEIHRDTSVTTKCAIQHIFKISRDIKMTIDKCRSQDNFGLGPPGG